MSQFSNGIPLVCLPLSSKSGNISVKTSEWSLLYFYMYINMYFIMKCLSFKTAK